MATRGLFSVSNVTPLPINGMHINTVLTQLSSDPTAVIDTSDQLLLFPMAHQPSGPGSPHYRGFTITLRHTTVGRTPLDE